MSLSISPSPAAPSSDGPAGSAASAKWDPNGLPFEAILNEQTNATDAEADLLAGLLPGVGLGVRARPTRDDDIALDAAILNVLGKNKSANEAASMAWLVVQDVLRRLESFDAPGLSGDKESGPANVPSGPAVDDQLTQNLRAALVEIKTAAAPTEEAPPADDRLHKESGPANVPTGPAVDDQLTQNLRAALVEIKTAAAHAEQAPPADDRLPVEDTPASTDIDISPPMIDLLLEESAYAQADKSTHAQTDKAAAAEEPPARPAAVAPAAALVDAVRAAFSQGASSDQDKDSNQPAGPGIDRRSSKSITAPTLHLAEAVARLDSKTPGAASSPTAAAPLPNEDGVVSSIVQTMRLQMRDGVGTAVVHLEPDYLGAVSIALRVENGVVTASLHAENPQVRAWMEANAPLLSESLAGQGLSLDRLVITDERIDDERSADRRHQQEQEQEQRARQRPRRGEASTFEVIV